MQNIWSESTYIHINYVLKICRWYCIAKCLWLVHYVYVCAHLSLKTWKSKSKHSPKGSNQSYFQTASSQFTLLEQLACFQSWCWLITLLPLASWTIRFFYLFFQKWMTAWQWFQSCTISCLWQVVLKETPDPACTLVSHKVQCLELCFSPCTKDCLVM